MPKNDNIKLLLLLMEGIRNDIQVNLHDSCSFMHIKALNFISSKNDPSMKDLADYLKITSPGATLVIDRLADNKDIERKPDPDDRRVIRLVVTKKGQTTLDGGMKIIKERLAERLSVLNKSEQESLGSILDKLIKYNGQTITE